MGRPRKQKTESAKIIESKVADEKAAAGKHKAELQKQMQKQVQIIVENAKLLSTGKLRNTFFLEKAARALTELEAKFQKANN